MKYKITDKKGGYLFARDVETGAALTEPMQIGEIDESKRQKYCDYCQEKADRLLVMAREHGHVCSRQSRNPDDGQWGGAILVRANGVILSFSGLPELADEAYMTMLAFRLPGLDMPGPNFLEIADYDDPTVNIYLNLAA